MTVPLNRIVPARQHGTSRARLSTTKNDGARCRMAAMMRARGILLCCVALLGIAPAARAQDPPPPPQGTPPPPPPPQQQAAAEPEAPPDKLLTDPELEQLVAPIALYPDDLVAQV